MSDPTEPRPTEESDEEDWAEEIRRLRRERGAALAERLEEPGDKEPPIG